MTKILGISAFYHDSAAALIEDGKIVSCIQEERISRKKNDHSFPRLSIKKILEIRRYVENRINWKCKLSKIYFKKNLGPKFALHKAINKVFLREKRLIIVDHDCLCDNSFFRFMDELLEIYEYENKVKIIEIFSVFCATSKKVVGENKSLTKKPLQGGFFNYH